MHVGKDAEADEFVAKVHKTYEQAVEMFPDELQAHANMAMFYMNTNQ